MASSSAPGFGLIVKSQDTTISVVQAQLSCVELAHLHSVICYRVCCVQSWGLETVPR